MGSSLANSFQLNGFLNTTGVKGMLNEKACHENKTNIRFSTVTPDLMTKCRGGPALTAFYALHSKIADDPQ